MPDHGVNAAIAERRHQPERIAHQIGEPERGKIAVVVRIPSGGAAITALVRRDHVIAGRCENRHHLAPAKGEFGKAMQQQHAGPAARFEAGFQHVHAQAVDIFHVAGADGGGKRDLGEDGHCLRLSFPVWARVDRMSVSSSAFPIAEGTFSHKARREGRATPPARMRRVGKAQRAHHHEQASRWWARRFAPLPTLRFRPSPRPSANICRADAASPVCRSASAATRPRSRCSSGI